MPHSAKVIALTATALLTAAVLTVATPNWADAQQPLKVTAVRSIDEPGLNPYQEEIITGCLSQSCEIQFPAIPVGRRLVVKHVSINGFMGMVARLGTSDADAASVALAGFQPVGTVGEGVLSELVHFTVPGGLNPVIQVSAIDKVRATIVRHLITP